ncbi:MAG: hypothetical protein ACRBN8_17425 [Nannocystales bacterium]
MTRASSVFVIAAILSACSVSVGSKPASTPSGSAAAATLSPDPEAPSDEAATGGAPVRANPAGAPTRTNPEDEGTRPATKADSYAEGIAVLDVSAPGTFAAAVALFIEFHPAGSTRASTIRLDLESFLDLVEATTAAADVTVRGSDGLMAAACAQAGFDCGTATEDDRAQLRALQERGVRFGYAGEGTVRVAVDHRAVAQALDPALDEPSTRFLAATHASALLSEGFDEGGFSGDAALAVDALVRWEGLVADPGPYAAIAPRQAADVRRTYLRLCYDGEHQKPPCQANKALRASYSRFGKRHPDSPSAPVVAAFYQALRRRRWQASADELDAMVTKALAAGPA